MSKLDWRAVPWPERRCRGGTMGRWRCRTWRAWGHPDVGPETPFEWQHEPLLAFEYDVTPAGIVERIVLADARQWPRPAPPLGTCSGRRTLGGSQRPRLLPRHALGDGLARDHRSAEGHLLAGLPGVPPPAVEGVIEPGHDANKSVPMLDFRSWRPSPSTAVETTRRNGSAATTGCRLSPRCRPTTAGARR